MDELYSEVIIEHYKNPKNFGEIENPDYNGRGANASCGDMVEFYIKGDGRVDEVSFQGIGCALSTASSSMLSEKIKGLGFEKVLKMSVEDLEKMMGFEISPTRLKCVELPLKTIKEILSKDE
jgi:nitrogen fixation NifU-like protein